MGSLIDHEYETLTIHGNTLSAKINNGELYIIPGRSAQFGAANTSPSHTFVRSPIIIPAIDLEHLHDLLEAYRTKQYIEKQEQEMNDAVSSPTSEA